MHFSPGLPILASCFGVWTSASFSRQFLQYAIAGFRADRIEDVTLNNEYKNTRWNINNADGVPMIALSVTEALVLRSIQSMQRLCGLSPSIIPGIRRPERSNTIHIKNRKAFAILTLFVVMVIKICHTFVTTIVLES